MGLDEVRRFNVLQRAAIPCYGDADTLKEVRRTFAYIFESNDEGGGIPLLDLHALDGPVSIGGETFTRCRCGMDDGGFWVSRAELRVPHRLQRHPRHVVAAARGLDTLAIDALRHRPHPTHFTVEQAVACRPASPPADLVDAHLPRPAARGHERLVASGSRDGVRRVED